MKTYKRGDRIPERAQQIWLILAAHAVLKPDRPNVTGRGWSGKGKGLIAYGDLAEAMGMSAKAGLTLSRHLGLIGYFCQQEGLPPLNAIAVNVATGTPGSGVIETDGYRADQKNVLKFDWFSLRPPTIRALRAVYDTHIAQRKEANEPDDE